MKNLGSNSVRKRKGEPVPHTTGIYIGRREAMRAANEEKERSLQLAREERIRNLESRELLRKSKISGKIKGRCG